MIAELKTTYTRHRAERIEEFYTRDGSTRTIYRFTFPDTKTQKHLEPTQQMVVVGLEDDFYQECEREPFQKNLYEKLQKQFAQATIRETSKIHAGGTKVETIYLAA